MCRYLFLLAFILVGCSGDGGQSQNPVPAYHQPTITDLAISPHLVAYVEGGGTAAVTAEVGYRDAGRDVQALWVQMPDGTSVEFSESLATDAGTFTEDIAIPTNEFGAFSMEFWLVDKAGNSSVHVTEIIGVIGDGPSSAGGIWHGTLSNDRTGQSFDITGVITEDNSVGRFMINGETSFILRDIAINSLEITATISASAGSDDEVLPEGSAHGALIGQLVKRSRIEFIWTLESGEYGTVILDYDDVYERGSDIARLVGTWKDSSGDIINIDALGEIFSQDEYGCVINGLVEIIDAVYNVYSVETDRYCVMFGSFHMSGLGVLGDEADMNDAFTVILSSRDFFWTSGYTLLRQ